MTLNSQGRWKKRGLKEKREWGEDNKMVLRKSVNPLTEKD
jgi:hypothetical protein